MKHIITFLLLVVSISVASAEDDNIAYSSSFETVDGFHKILQLSNGNTVLLQFSLPDLIEVRVYNKFRKEISYKKIQHFHGGVLDGKAWSVYLRGIYEIDGKPVLFLGTYDKGNVIKRLILNEMTGDIESKEVIVHVPQTKTNSSSTPYYIPYYRDQLWRDGFVIKKDRYSNAYMILYSDYNNDDYKKSIEMYFFNVKEGKHKLINNCTYSGTKKKRTRVIDGDFLPNNNFFISAYNRNTTEILISTIDVATSVQKHSSVNFKINFFNPTSIVKYNKYTDKIQMLTTLYAKKNGRLNISITLADINYNTLQRISSIEMSNTHIQKYIDANFDIKSDYTFKGVPQDFIVNDDNTTIILSEEANEGHGSQSMNNTGYANKFSTLLGTIGFTELDNTGKEIGGYALYKRQITRQLYSQQYMLDKKNGMLATEPGTGLLRPNQFFSYDYINTEKNKYFIYNETKANFVASEKDMKVVNKYTSCNSILHQYKSNKSTRKYLFRTPVKKINTFSYIGVSDYEPKSKTYVTVIIEKDGRKKMARVAWVKLD